MRVTEDQWSPGSDEVDVALSVSIENIAALTAPNEKRYATDRLPRTHRTINTAGNAPIGAKKNFLLCSHGGLASLTLDAHTVKKKTLEKKNFVGLFLLQRNLKRTIKIFPDSPARKFLSGLRESTRKMSYASAWRQNCFQLVWRQKFHSRLWTTLPAAFTSCGAAGVINTCG